MTYESRYFSASRRAFLRRGAVLGAAAAMPGLIAACGSSDADVFAEAETSAPTSTTAAPEATTTSSTTASTADPATASSTTTSEAPADLGPLSIAYTYTMADGGKRLNPYLAVWIEDADGVLLRTVDLTYQQDRKGTKWLDDLKSWWRIDQARISAGGTDHAATISSATRGPGSFSLLWDGLDDAGQAVTAEEVVVCIESARERGPHSLICQSVNRVSASLPLALPADGELSGATVDIA